MTTTDRVSEILKCADLSRLRLGDVIDATGLNRRRLESRLKIEGTSYAELLKTERMQRARDLLNANPHADGHGLAKKCGYMQLTSAYRAFRHWFGVSFYDVKVGREMI